MIRQVEQSDIAKVGELLKEFITESLGDYGVGLDKDHFNNVAQMYVSHSLICEIAGKVVGVIAGEIKQYPLDGSRVYQEAVWYVSKNHRRYGIKLIQELERKCKEEWKVSHIVMALMENCNADNLGKFYSRLGYKPLERHLIKSLGGQ